MPLSPDQLRVLNKFLDFLLDDTMSEIAISGPGGTGKSYLTNPLIKAANKHTEFLKLLKGIGEDILSIHLTATTNKAAKVLGDLSGQPTSTIHSLLGLKIKNDFRTGKVLLGKSRNAPPIFNSVIFIDEASMVNTQLLEIIREQTIKCKIIYIGDSYQLAPVKEKTCPVFDGTIPQLKLTTIQRQVAGSPIIQLGTEFRKALDTNIFPPLASIKEAIQHVPGPVFKELVTHTYLHEPTLNPKIVAWTNERVHQYNEYIRGLTSNNPAYDTGESVVTNKPLLSIDKIPIAPTESILVISDISEGVQYDIDGYHITLNEDVKTFQPKKQSDVIQLMKKYASKKDWRMYFEIKEFFADLRPIHACTVHKSQGSTYNTIFIDVDDIGRNSNHDEVARMMYVAITRAKSKVIMTGNLPKHFYN